MEENNTKIQASENSTSAQEQNSQEQNTTEVKTFTQEDVDKLITARLKREGEKWQEKLTESQKMAKMNAEQKAQYEKEKHEVELTNRESDITKRELKMTAKETLIEKGLPVELADTLVYTDAESCTSSIEAVEKAFRSAVEKAVDERIIKSGGTPRIGNTGQTVSGVEAKFYELNPQLKR